MKEKFDRALADSAAAVKESGSRLRLWRGWSFAFACNFFGGRGRNLSTCDESAPMSKLPPDADMLKMSRALIITLKVRQRPPIPPKSCGDVMPLFSAALPPISPFRHRYIRNSPKIAKAASPDLTVPILFLHMYDTKQLSGLFDSLI